ncbi:hypothetical protein GCM10027297_03260 [Parahaliea aestuarii]
MQARGLLTIDFFAANHVSRGGGALQYGGGQPPDSPAGGSIAEAGQGSARAVLRQQFEQRCALLCTFFRAL